MMCRRAFSLIELLVAISTGGTLMLLAIGTVQRAMQLASTSCDRVENNRSATRLAEQFRRDIHEAQTVIVNSPETIRISMFDATVVAYVAQGNRITREQPLAGGQTRREAFTFSEGTSGKFTTLDEPKRTIVYLQRETGLSKELRIDRQIAAVVGRLRKHELAGATLP